jgi:hypothetical protein
MRTVDETLRRITTGAAISVTGTLVESKVPARNLKFKLTNWKY